MLVSPFCFWELLTHLEEPDKFTYYKSHLMKLRYAEVLDDPDTSVERLVVRSTDDVHQRATDKDIIYAALDALQDCPSIAEFYGQPLEDQRGQRRLIVQCGERGRRVLADEEQRFAEFVGKIVAAAADGRVSFGTAEDRHEAALDLLHGWWLQLSDRVEPSDAARERFARLMYVYCSFVVHRAAHYKETKATIQFNDYEDARFCLHLHLDAPFVAVTGDSGLRRALQDAVAVLNSLKGLSWHTSLSVLETRDFRDQFAGTS
jgi:hypothetical protein